MSKLNILSCVCFLIAFAIQINNYVFEYIIGSSEYFNHHLQWTLAVIVIFPLVGIILGGFGKKGNLRLMAIVSNAIFLIAISPLALLNLWITTFGIW